MRQKEGQLDDKIRDYCKKNDIYYLKTTGGGNPDCIMCINGRFVSFETKVDDNTTSPLQDYFIEQIKRNEGVSLEIRSYKEAVEVIERLRK